MLLAMSWASFWLSVVLRQRMALSIFKIQSTTWLTRCINSLRLHLLLNRVPWLVAHRQGKSVRYTAYVHPPSYFSPTHWHPPCVLEDSLPGETNLLSPRVTTHHDRCDAWYASGLGRT